MKIDNSTAFTLHTKIVPVAVIGIGCRFPGAIDGPESYWRALIEKRCAIVDVPADRWNLSSFYSSDPDSRGKMRTSRGGFLTTDVFGFDPAFFDMSPREAMAMDPQQRLLLQVAFETIQDAGLRIADLKRARAGVCVGISTSDFAQTQQDGALSDIFAGTGSAFSIAANRISHRFDLLGPSVSVDTACSSALVALDQAVRHLSMGTCDIAFAGGVNCMLDPRPFIAFSSANMLSPSGNIYTFDARANGFVRGEGCGLVLLKPLDRAIADGNTIYGVIRQSIVNQDGHTKTLTSPSGEAQQKMLDDLLRISNCDPSDVDFVEAHGTGTPVGDPIEATAIGRVFGNRRRRAPVYVGSFKPNLGHLESASGIAGFIKALLVVHHGIVPPNLNFETPNPNIPFDSFAMAVPVIPTRLEAARAIRTVVNSFGFGGTNASVLIEEWRPPLHSPVSVSPQSAVPEATAPDQMMYVPLSAGSEAGLQLWARTVADQISGEGALQHEPIEAIVKHLTYERDAFQERAALILPRQKEDLVAGLRLLAAKADRDAITQTLASPVTILRGRPTVQPRFAIGFSGQGGQWWAMSRRLLQESPIYRRSVEQFDEVMRPLSGWSTVEELLRNEQDSRINDPDLTQAAIFANQLGLYNYWKAEGLRPELLIGHSFGEVAATHIAGVIDLETVARIIDARGRIPGNSTRRGAMAAIGLTVDQLTPFMPQDDSVVIAAFNGPVAQTIAGMEAGVVAILKAVAEHYPDALARRMTMDFGWHSAHLDDCEAAFRRDVGKITFKAPQLPIVSTVTGILETQFDTDYWWQNLRQPVSFTKAVRFCFDYGINAFLEMGPHRTLTPLIRGIAQENNISITAINSLDRQADDFETLARAKATLFVNGVMPEGKPADYTRTGKAFRALKMPWANQHLLSMPPATKRFLFEAPVHPLLGRRDASSETSWTHELILKNHKFLNDHRVNGDCLFPAVGYMEMMGAAIRNLFGDGPVELRDFKIHEALSIIDDDIILLATHFDAATGRIRISSQHRGADSHWRLRAEAQGWRYEYELKHHFDGEMTPHPVEPKEFYEFVRQYGLEYGPTFQPLKALWINGDRRVTAQLSSAPQEHAAQYFAFPGLFDGVLQSCVIMDVHSTSGWQPGQPLPSQDRNGRTRVILPVGARKILLAAPLGNTILVQARAGLGEGEISFVAFDQDGHPLIAIEDLRTKTLEHTHSATDAAGHVYEERFESIDPALLAKPAAYGRWLIIRDSDSLSAPPYSAGLGSSISMCAMDDFITMDIDRAARYVEILLNESTAPLGIVFDASCAGSTLTSLSSGADISLAAENLSCALVALGQVFARLQPPAGRVKLVVLTHHGRVIREDSPMPIQGVAQSALIGLARTLQNEFQDILIVVMDADSAALADGAFVANALLSDLAEPEFILRSGSAYAVRIAKLKLEDVTPAKQYIDTAISGANYRVTMSSPGLIDNIVLREVATPELQADEILVEVAAVGLNFRDVMAASSILPDELTGEDAYWRNLGLEFSGTVVKLGADVSHLQVGDRVMGMGKGFLRRYAKVNAHAVMSVPDHMDLIEAATMPVAYITAHYSLTHVGQLAEGETVLVHLASGGVGLAAINVARHLGARIFATAGNTEKRAYLAQMGIQNVMNSRGLFFAEETLHSTKGRGVDVVLNALSGAGIDKSLECLAPFGRLVEIGKRDLADNKPIGLRSLYENKTYSVVDLSTLPVEKPKLFFRLLREVEARIAAGDYQPIPATQFPLADTASAMRSLAKALHIGKVVVAVHQASVEVDTNLDQPLQLSSGASYLVTGGLRGFGAKVADWLSQRGAGRIILANRTGVADEAAAILVATMQARGTDIVSIALDITDGAAVAAAIAEYSASDKPLRGIIHGAAVIEDAFITQLDRSKIARVLSPKIAGVVNLHHAVEHIDGNLDFFVSFSSIAQLLGSPGQANYTAANSVLNAFAAFRRGQGKVGHTVAWGMISGSGFVARSEAITNYLDSTGIRPIADTDAAAALGHFLRGREANTAFANLDWAAISRAFPAIGANPKLKALLQRSAGNQSRIQSELMAAPRRDWDDILARMICTEVAKVLKVDENLIALNRKLTELGLDSLSSFELKNRIEGLVEVSIPVARFLQTPTIAGLSKLVATAFEEKIKAAEISKARMDTQDSSSTQMTRSEFRPLPRQTAWLLLSQQPMTSSAVRQDIDILAGPIWVETADLDILTDRLARLAAQHDALRLTAVHDTADQMTLQFTDAPTFTKLGSGEILPPLSLPGSLWSFGLSEKQGCFEVQIRAHRAAADVASVRTVLALLAGHGELSGHGESFASYALKLLPKEDSPQTYSTMAYWREILSSAPSAIPMHERARARAPAGLGRNRGSIGWIETELSLTGISAKAYMSLSHSDKEALFLSAYAIALGAEFDQPTILIERHFSAFGKTPDLIGPVTSSHPVVLDSSLAEAHYLARRGLSEIEKHFSLDTPALEGLFQTELRQRDVDLRQFGFGYVLKADFEHPFPISTNEVQLVVTNTDNDIGIRIFTDSGVVTQAHTEKILEHFIKTITPLLGIETTSLAVAPLRRTEPVSAAVTPASPVKTATLIHNNLDQLPLALNQRALLRALSHPQTSTAFRQYWIISRAMHVAPQLDIYRLRNAMEQMTHRHEAMRTRFVLRDDSTISALLLPVTQPAFFVESYDDEDSATTRAESLSSQLIDPFTEALFQVYVLRCGGKADLIVAKCHHAVADGYSIGLLVEEMMQAYLGIALAPVTITTREYITEFDLSFDPSAKARRDAYLEQLYAHPAPQLPDLYGIKPRLPESDGPICHPAREIVASFTQAQSELLRQRTRHIGITPSAMLVAALGQTIAARGRVDDVIMHVPSAMRSDRRLDHYLNWVARDALVRVPASMAVSLEHAASQVSLDLNKHVDMARLTDIYWESDVHDKIIASNSYISRFASGMMTANKWGKGTTSAPMQRVGVDNAEIDMGIVKIKPMSKIIGTEGILNDIDLRSFEGQNGFGLRFAYNVNVFSSTSAQDILRDVIDRMGMGNADVETIDLQ